MQDPSIVLPSLSIRGSERTSKSAGLWQLEKTQKGTKWVRCVYCTYSRLSRPSMHLESLSSVAQSRCDVNYNPAMVLDKQDRELGNRAAISSAGATGPRHGMEQRD